MIWIFDSGSWWLTLLFELRKILPEYDYLYFGDYEHCPYGEKTGEEVFLLTKSGVLKLKEAGAKIVILACNTATSAAIRKLQKAEKEIWIKVLGVTIPAAEKVVDEKYKKISVFATHASVKNKLYKTRVWILDESVAVQEIALKDLAVLVEDFLQEKISRDEIQKYIKEKTKYIWEDTQAIILGCTHYSHIIDIFRELFPKQEIICPSYEAAQKFVDYLQRHPEIEQKLARGNKVKYL